MPLSNLAATLYSIVGSKVVEVEEDMVISLEVPWIFIRMN